MREPRNERVSAKFQTAHTFIREFSNENGLSCKLTVKLNGDISDVQFKPSLKCGIAENINFRKCRISAHERAHVYPRVFERKLEVKSAAPFERCF